MNEKGVLYRGNWLDGKKDGKGEQLEINGDKYSGDWKYDKKNGGRDGKVANRNADANTNDDEDEDEDSENETEESVELDEITVRSFLKICMDAVMLRGWCQNYGKRPHTTGGAKVRVLEKSKALIRNVKLLSSLNPRQIHRLASEFKSKTYDRIN